MQKKVFQYLCKYTMIQPGDRVVVGVSGGADSVCLLYLLMEFQKEIPFLLGVVHVNHGLRGEEADADEAFVRQLCQEQGIPCRVYAYHVGEIAQREKLTVEEAGRKVRGQAFEHFKTEWNANRIALAHHRNDVAETMLHNLARGSSLTGLCSVHPVRNLYIRPLLCMNREEIEQYLKDRSIIWRVDSSNRELTYTRNKIRHRVVDYLVQEINPRAVEHMADTAADLLEVKIYLEQAARQAEDTHVIKERGFIRLAAGLQEEAAVIRKAVLHNCFGYVAKGQQDLSRKHLQQLDQLFTKTVGKCICLPHGIVACRSYQGIIMENGQGVQPFKSAPVMLPITVPGKSIDDKIAVICQLFPKNDDIIPEKTYTKWFDYDKMKDNLVIRTRRAGDYLAINRLGGKKKLKDYLIDIKVPLQERDGVLLLASGSEILWVIGFRISEKYKIDKNTEQIVSVQITGREIHER